MIDMTVLVNQLIQLFIIICIGYFIFKISILNEAVNKHINSLIINVTMPLMIIHSVLSMSSRPESSTIISLFVISIAFYLLMPIVAFIVVKVMLKTLRIVKARQGVYMFMLIFSNVGFMGIPILQAACGKDGTTAVFYAAVLNIFFNLAVFTYGVLMIGYGDTVQTTLKLKSLLSPGITCSVLAIIIYAADIHFPKTIESVIGTVGNLTSPLAMLLVGSTLASMKLSEVFNVWRIYVFSFIKQFVLPILLYPIFRMCIGNDLLFNVIFIEFLMPVANISLMLATEYDLDYKFVSKTIFISTAMSLISIPVVMYLCGIIY
jgi:predicted permease